LEINIKLQKNHKIQAKIEFNPHEEHCHFLQRIPEPKCNDKFLVFLLNKLRTLKINIKLHKNIKIQTKIELNPREEHYRFLPWISEPITCTLTQNPCHE
jgi:hypothetical protein